MELSKMQFLSDQSTRVNFIAKELASKVAFKISLNRISKTDYDALKTYITTTFPDEKFTTAEFDSAWQLMIPMVHKLYATATAGSYDTNTTV